MRSLKLFGYTKNAGVTTTVSDQRKPVFPDLVGRGFTAPAPNHIYVGDTHVPADCLWLEYLPGHGNRLLFPQAGGVRDR